MQPKFKTLLKIIVSVGLLLLIFSRFSLDEMWRVIRTVQIPFLAGAMGIALAIFLSKTLKWWILGRQVDQSISVTNAALSLLIGMGVGLVTPSRVGEVARVTYLPTTRKVDLIGLVVVDRLIDLAVIILTGGIALGMVFDSRLGLVFIVPTTAVLLLLFVPRLPGNALNWLSNLSFMPAKSFIHRITQGLLTLNGRVLTLILILAIITFGLGIFQFYWLLRSFGVHSATAATVTFPIITVASVLPITIGGFGTREGATVFVLSMFNISEPIAVNAALLSFILNTLIPGVIGLFISPIIKGNIQAAPSQAHKKP